MYKLPASDRVIVRIEKLYDDTIKKGELELVVPFDGEAAFKEGRTNYHNKRTYGIVVGAPERLGETEAYRKYNGHPRPTYYNPGYVPTRSDVPLELQKRAKNSYKCGLHKDTVVYWKDLPVEVKVGDKVNFFYTEGDKDSIIDRGKDYLDVWVNYSRIISVEEQPIAGWLLCEHSYSDEVVEVMPGVRGKISPSGLVVSCNDAPDYLEAKIVAYSSPFEHDLNLAKGDTIIYVPNSDREVKINGKDYLAIHQSEVVAIKDAMRIMPVNGYVLIRPEYDKKIGAIHVPDTVDHVSVGYLLETEFMPAYQYVRFESRSNVVVRYTRDKWFIKHEDIFYTFEQ